LIPHPEQSQVPDLGLRDTPLTAIHRGAMNPCKPVGLYRYDRSKSSSQNGDVPRRFCHQPQWDSRMDVRMVWRRLGRMEPPRPRRGRRSRDGAPQLRDHGPHWAASEGPIATAMNEKPKAVFSGTLEKAEWGPAEIFGGDLGAAIAELKARDDEGTVLVHGGPDFAKSLTPRPYRRVPADHGPDCDRRGPQPIRRAGRAPEARRRR
jgi:hypothetical protein